MSVKVLDHSFPSPGWIAYIMAEEPNLPLGIAIYKAIQCNTNISFNYILYFFNFVHSLVIVIYIYKYNDMVVVCIIKITSKV